MAEDKAHLVVLSGVFYQDDPDTDLMVADDDLGAVSVHEQLADIVGNAVAIVVHHCPPDPPDPDRWGGGSCLLERTGHCHAGHHDRPGWLYEHTVGGVLLKEEDVWWVVKPDGERVKLFFHFLVGHYSQIVVTALPNIDKLKAELEDEMKNPTVEGVQDKITQMRDLLSMINREKDSL